MPPERCLPHAPGTREQCRRFRHSRRGRGAAQDDGASRARVGASATASPPEWSELEWAIARSAAAMQGISALLANRLSWSGPPAWQRFSRSSASKACCVTRASARCSSASTRRRGSGDRLRRAQGSRASCARSLRPGERPMGDVDLLVASRDLRAIAAAMADIGYVEAFTTRRHRVYEPRRQGRATRLRRARRQSAEDRSAHGRRGAAARAQSRYHGSGCGRVGRDPGSTTIPTSSRCCCTCCSMRPATCARTRCGRYSCTTSLLVASLLYEHDWRALLEQAARERRAVVDVSAVGADGALLPRAHPAGGVARGAASLARASCASLPARQTLTDVSWSNLRIHAFPGIAWSRTPLDALRFIRSRVVAEPPLARGARVRSARPAAARPRALVRPVARRSRSCAGCSRGRRASRRSSRFARPSRAQASGRRRQPIDSQYASLVLPPVAHVRHRDGLRRGLDGRRRCAAISPRAAERRHPRARAEPAKLRAHGGGRSARNGGIRVLPVAASDRRSEAPLFVIDADYAPGRDLARRGMSSLYERSDWTRLSTAVQVPTVRLDELLVSEALDGGPIALWIDTEGMAFEVIRGGSGCCGRRA